MKPSPKSKKASVWGDSKLIQKEALSRKDVRPWASLSDKDKKRFAAAFTTDSAYGVRKSLLLNGEDLHLVRLLSLYQSGVEKGLNGINSSWEIEMRKILMDDVYFAMLLGNWHSLRFLADYGAKHAKYGLGKGKFPAVANLIENADDILAVRILKAFADLSGVRIEDLLLPPIPNPEVRLPRLRFLGIGNLLNPKFSPKSLPTKKALQTALQEGSDSEVDGFSRQLKRVGLDGLPKSPRGK